jgi:hypothetical protein
MTLKSELDQIFEKGCEVFESYDAKSLEILAAVSGFHVHFKSDPLSYYNTLDLVLEQAKPYLLDRDKVGWLKSIA